MVEPSRSPIPEIVCEFYESYTKFIDLIILTWMRAQDRLPLTHTLVREVRVNLSKETIFRFLIGPKFMGSVTTIKLDY